MEVTFIGIDPGVTGAIATLRCARNFAEVLVDDLPVTTDTFTANQSKMLDITAFAVLLETMVRGSSNCVVLATERMQGMGFKTPPRTLTMLAEMSGNIEATVRMSCRERKIPLFIRKFLPKTWTHWMFPDSGNRQDRKSEAKNESLEKARELFPELVRRINLKKHHDRAEALLLAFTSIAELQGCVVDPKYKKMADLVDVYLNHAQSAGSKTAKITDILYENILPKGLILDEITKRKNG